ncbi:MAG: hypothetical protein Q8K59_05780 [Nitrosomonas sp.]|nr:hypothetical protein [Nitrosomonas sp.]MDP1950593.1 hypothetical protein [Nitrosomonas sp.]
MNQSSFTWPGRIQNDPAHDLIVAYLTIDLQKSSKWTEELLQKIREVKSGLVSSWERTGNAYCLHLYPGHIEIEEDYAEETGGLIKVSLDDFEAAVIAWQAFIKK